MLSEILQMDWPVALVFAVLLIATAILIGIRMAMNEERRERVEKAIAERNKVASEYPGSKGS